MAHIVSLLRIFPQETKLKKKNMKILLEVLTLPFIKQWSWSIKKKTKVKIKSSFQRIDRKLFHEIKIK